MRLKKRREILKKILFLAGFIFCLVFFPEVKAGNLPTLEIGPTESIPQLAVKLYNWFVRIAGILALLMIVWGGVEYAFFSAAMPARVEDAKDRIRQAVIGLAIVLISWVALRLINPELVSPPGP